MNNNIFLALVLVLLGGCSTVGSDQTLHPVDCTSGEKSDDCLPVANIDKKMQKKTIISVQTDQQIERRARTAKIVENKKSNDQRTKVKIEASPLAQDNKVVSKQDSMAQKKIDTKPENAFSVSMDCVKNSIKKKDDGRSHVRAVAYDVAVLCTKRGVRVESIANASIPLVLQNRTK